MSKTKQGTGADANPNPMNNTGAAPRLHKAPNTGAYPPQTTTSEKRGKQGNG